jgi:competence protein ComEC
MASARSNGGFGSAARASGAARRLRDAVPGAGTGRRYRPLVPVALALVAGILAAEYLGGGVLFWSAGAGLAGLCWAILYAAGARDKRLVAPLLVFLAAAGAARYRVAVDPPADDVARLVAGDRRIVTLEGVVTAPAREHRPPTDVFLPSVPYYIRTVLEVECRKAEVDGREVPARGQVGLVVREALPAGERGVPVPGDRIRVVGVLAPPLPPMNPGSFDMARYQRRQGIRASIRTDHWEAVRAIEPAADRIRWTAGAIARAARGCLDRVPTERGRAVLAAVMFGRKDLLRQEVDAASGVDIEQNFILSGTADLLAVSGLNVGIMAALILLPLRLAGLGPRWTAALVAVVVLVYALVTEMTPSVLRASVLIWTLCLGWMLGRRPLILNSLGAALVVILLARPGDLFTLSLQLSFGGVLGLVVLTNKVQAILRGGDPGLVIWRPRWRWAASLRDWAREVVCVSIAAALATMPLIAHSFNLVAWLSPVGHLLLFPLVFALLASGAVLAVVGLAVPAAAPLVAMVPDAIARATAQVAAWVAAVPGGHFYTPGFSPAWLLVIYGLLAAWAWRERLGVTRRHLRIAALAAAAVFLWTTGRSPPEAVRVTFLAVGNGNANLLELPNGRVLLYDAGSSLSYASAGHVMIAPALWSRGIDRVDAVFLTHAHFDHFKDILPLVDRFGIRRVYVPPTFLRGRLSVDNAVVEALFDRGVEVAYFAPGDRLSGTGEVAVRALWPRGPASQTQKINDGSLAIRVEHRGRSLLLTGDMEDASLDVLRAAEPDLRADVLLWPHHGGSADAVGRMAAAVGARVVVVSAGRSYPPRPPPAWVAEQGTALYRTGEHGAVTVDLLPGGPRAAAFCETEASRPYDQDEPDGSDADHEVVGVNDLVVGPLAEHLGELAGLEALDLPDVVGGVVGQSLGDLAAARCHDEHDVAAVELALDVRDARGEEALAGEDGLGRPFVDEDLAARPPRQADPPLPGA